MNNKAMTTALITLFLLLAPKSKAMLSEVSEVSEATKNLFNQCYVAIQVDLSEENLKRVEDYLEKGADIYAKDEHEQTPYDIATKYGCDSLLKLLKKRAALLLELERGKNDLRARKQITFIY